MKSTPTPPRRIDPLAPLLQAFKSERAKTSKQTDLFELGVVVNTDGLGGYQVQLDREDTPTVKFYRALNGGPAVNDRVLLARIGRSKLILGTIT